MQKYLNATTVLLLVGAVLLAACGGGGAASVPGSGEDATAGKSAYNITCLACHGPEAKGVAGLGKDLTTSEFVKSKTDAELKAFILAGRPRSDPLNTTGIDMPPKGGNPALDETDIENIVTYLRTIHQ